MEKKGAYKVGLVRVFLETLCLLLHAFLYFQYSGRFGLVLKETHITQIVAKYLFCIHINSLNKLDWVLNVEKKKHLSSGMKV